jgi:uridine kinase
LYFALTALMFYVILSIQKCHLKIEYIEERSEMKTMEIDFKNGVFYLTQAIQYSKKPILVSISGPTCSGKTYLADRLVNKLEEMKLKNSRLSLDDFFKDWKDLPVNEKRDPLFDRPTSFRYDEFQKIISELWQGNRVNVPVYEISESRRIGLRQMESSPIIIAEGLFAILFATPLALNSIKVYVDAEESVCLKRNIERNTKRFDCLEDDVKYFFYERVWGNNVKYVFPQKLKADIVIKN